MDSVTLVDFKGLNAWIFKIYILVYVTRDMLK